MLGSCHFLPHRVNPIIFFALDSSRADSEASLMDDTHIVLVIVNAIYLCVAGALRLTTSIQAICSI